MSKSGLDEGETEMDTYEVTDTNDLTTLYATTSEVDTYEVTDTNDLTTLYTTTSEVDPYEVTDTNDLTTLYATTSEVDNIHSHHRTTSDVATDHTKLYTTSETSHDRPTMSSSVSYNTFSINAEKQVSNISSKDSAPPTSPPTILTKPKLILLNICWYGLSVVFLVLSVQVIPSQIEAMVGGAHKGRWLGVLIASGALLTFIISPLVGMYSDHLVCQYGRRRPIMVAGAFVLCLGACGMAFSASDITVLLQHTDEFTTNNTDCERDLEAWRCAAYLSHKEVNIHNIPHLRAHKQWAARAKVSGNIGLYLVFYLFVTSSFSSITVAYNALVADMSHPSQRGLCSGMMGAMILLGNVSGAAVGVAFVKMGVLSIYGCILSIMVLCLTVTVLTTPEPPAKLPYPISCRDIVTGFYMPLKQHDFRWVFITRLLMQQGIATITEFLEFWMSDMVPLPNCWTPQTCVALLLLPLLFAAAISSVICGVISDKLQRRKPLVIASAVTMCTAACVMAFIHGDFAFAIAIVMASVFGIGFGSFQAVDFALVMDVLPDEKDKAKDIAVWHLAMVLPQAIATPIGGIILDLFEQVNCHIGLGYIILFLVTSFYFFMSGLLVTRIRSVR